MKSEVPPSTSEFRPPSSNVPKAILLDIEGTTTPIAFVYDVLFPYARAHLRAYLEDPANRDALVEPLRMLQEQRSRDEGPPEGGPHEYGHEGGPHEYGHEGGPHEYIVWLMDRDRKSPALKLLQGQIWERGYRTGELKGDVFADVAPAFARWTAAGIRIAIYSSGSELAQRLLFGTARDGDLTTMISGFFDTRVGAKASAASYGTIARALDCPPGNILFISDVTAELDAAASAGFQVLLCERPGNHPQPNHAFNIIRTFDDVDLPRKHDNTTSS